MGQQDGSDPVWHGQDKQAAILRAESIGGYVIKSKPPADVEGEPGYWSDTTGFIRNWETLEYTAKVNR